MLKKRKMSCDIKEGRTFVFIKIDLRLMRLS